MFDRNIFKSQYLKVNTQKLVFKDNDINNCNYTDHKTQIIKRESSGFGRLPFLLILVDLSHISQSPSVLFMTGLIYFFEIIHSGRKIVHHQI